MLILLVKVITQLEILKIPKWAEGLLSEMLGNGWVMEWMDDTSKTVMNTTFTFTYQFYHQDGDD